MSETTENTTTESLKTEKPTAENPTTENPTNEDPSTENPTTETVDASTTDTGKAPPFQLNYNVWCPKCEMLRLGNVLADYEGYVPGTNQ
ncbi:hypothetical protein NXS19_000180 [Fusarium pseudograminearum]|nr:hypothetical protein NXS19_000180 [Fusarium pseudograminearum]